MEDNKAILGCFQERQGAAGRCHRVLIWQEEDSMEQHAKQDELSVCRLERAAYLKKKKRSASISLLTSLEAGQVLKINNDLATKKETIFYNTALSFLKFLLLFFVVPLHPLCPLLHAHYQSSAFWYAINLRAARTDLSHQEQWIL